MGGRQWWVSVPTGQGQPTGSPWEPPADGGYRPVRPARRGHVVLWVVLAIGIVAFVLPLLVVVVTVANAKDQEHQPPQSLFDDASTVAAALEYLSPGVPGDSTASGPYKPSDPLPVRISRGSVTVGDSAVTPPEVVALASGNTVTVTGNVGRFCVRVSHQGAQPMFYDSAWHAVQYGRGRSGACS